MLIRPGLKLKTAAFSFKPDIIADSVKNIDFNYLKSLGITTCFIDLDGTVVGRGSFDVDNALEDRLKHSGLDIKIATNRPRSRSLKRLKDDLSATGVIHPQGFYGKPTKRYITSALKDFGLKRGEVVMIGDRYIQDILGANRSGIYSLLVYKLGQSQGKIDAFISKIEKNLTLKTEKYYRKL